MKHEQFNGYFNYNTDKVEKKFEYKFGKIILNFDFIHLNSENTEKFIDYILEQINSFGSEGWQCKTDLTFEYLENLLIKIINDNKFSLKHPNNEYEKPTTYLNVFLQRELKQFSQFNSIVPICNKCINKNSCLNFNTERIACHNFLPWFNTATINLSGNNKNNYTIDKFGVDINKK